MTHTTDQFQYPEPEDITYQRVASADGVVTLVPSPLDGR